MKLTISKDNYDQILDGIDNESSDYEYKIETYFQLLKYDLDNKKSSVVYPLEGLLVSIHQAYEKTKDYKLIELGMAIWTLCLPYFNQMGDKAGRLEEPKIQSELKELLCDIIFNAMKLFWIYAKKDLDYDPNWVNLDPISDLCRQMRKYISHSMASHYWEYLTKAEELVGTKKSDDPYGVIDTDPYYDFAEKLGYPRDPNRAPDFSEKGTSSLIGGFSKIDDLNYDDQEMQSEDNDSPSPSSNKLKPILIGVAVLAIVIFLISLFGNSDNESSSKLSNSYWLENSSSDLWHFSNNQLYGTSGTYNFEIDGDNVSFKLVPSDEWDFFSNSNNAVDGNWDFVLDEKSLKLKENGGKGRSLNFTKLTVTDLYRLGDDISKIWQNNIKGDLNFASVTGTTKKNQMKIPSRNFNQIGSGAGYKTYSVDGNGADFGSKCLFDYEFYKINDRTQCVEVMGVTLRCPAGQYSKVMSDNLRENLGKILSCTMINKKMTLDIGSEGFESNGYVTLGGTQRCSYAIAYNESWIAIVIGFNEKSFKSFIGIE